MKRILPMRLLAIFMCFAMLATVTPIFASADDSTPYLGINESTGKADKECFVSVENVITDGTKDLFVTGWNIVKGDVEFEERIVLPGSVNLILENGATLTATKGITVAEDGDFAIYAQSTDPDVMGKLVVPEGVSEYDAGIGGAEGKTCGNIAIYGGVVSVCGGGKGAAIGSSGTKTCGNITISGGIIDAVSTGDGAGIGSGREASCGTVTITDGYIRAECGEGAQPIGAGYLSSAVSVSVSMSCISTTMGTVRYINYAPIAGTDPTCTKAGSKAYCLDLISKNYYETFPFYEDRLIGNASAISTWYAEGGAGYLAPLGHDWQQVDADKHKCTRCDAIEMHTDKDENNLCDMCGVSVVPYLGYNEETGKADLQCAAVIDNVIDEVTDSFVTGWNIIKGNIEFENRIELPKDVKLILADGATLTADKGITVAENGNFSVYAQSTDEDTMGKLIVPESVEENGAGIGSGSGGDCGSIAIFGGTVSVQGGNGAAGIGSGYYEASCGDISILGGIMTAQGGNSAAGIGTGFNSSCGVITISGGNVIAQGEGYGSGVGVGNGVNALCNKVSITGGYIKASTEMDDNYIEAKQVSIDSSFETKYTADSMYINCIPFEETEADCTNNGALAYFNDSINDIYYTDFPFTEAVLIGDADALDAWKSEGGAGHKENPLGHDWQYQDGAKHICQRCKITKVHVDENKDTLCDMCGEIVTTYLDYNETTGQADLSRTVWVKNIITDGATDTFVTGWNVVEGNVTFENRIVLPKDVNLILADGATLTAKKGITVAENGSFAVYAQSIDKDTMGKLVVPEGVADNYPGIGSSDEADCGDIEIHGGVVTVVGGVNGAGIGSAFNRSCGNITISGGFVTACGGYGATGVGSGDQGDCGNIVISGGFVTASSGYGAAGIGSGFLSSCEGIVISGGTVIAQGGERAAGIGGGYATSCGKVTISSGNIKATAGGSNADPIGSGELADPVVEVNKLSTCTSTIIDKVQYVNCEFFPETEPDCITIGALAYFKDSIKGMYYTDFPFTEEVLIGDDDALAVWKAEGGAGHRENAWGHNWAYVAGNTHKCARCNLVENHTDEDKDGVCDECRVPLTMNLGWNETTGKADLVCYAYVEHVIDEATDSFASGWNIVKGNVTFDERIRLPGEVHLILEDGATLTAKKGITVASFGDFSIYAQSTDESTMGKLIVPEGVDVNNAGIGPIEGGICGNISIYGGKITAYGGESAAGIGGAYGDSEHTCGKVTIYGGIVNAYGGKSGSGIGVGEKATCKKVIIKGGVVNAYGGENGAGIGGASHGIEISGGRILAVGGDNSAGIGSGYGTGYCNRVDITGGYIKAIAGNINAESIGGAAMSGAVPVTIDSHCTSITKGKMEQYINYEETAAKEATCTTVGTLGYFTDYISGNYYTSFPFTENGLIGDATAFAAWKAQGGAGYLEKIPHKDTDGDHYCDGCHATDANYLDYNEITGKVDIEREMWGVNLVIDDLSSLSPGWYIVIGDVTTKNRITLTGDTKLILANGASLTAKKGISMSDTGNLAIYAQSNDKDMMGKLIVPEGVNNYDAGIGGSNNKACGSIFIYGGMVTVQGGNYAPAIGSVTNMYSCDITIRGGVVKAQGGYAGAAIGSGENSSCGNITISGGIVTATGSYSAGIGSGSGIGASCGNITISGGAVIATGANDGAGIGSGAGGSKCGTITISGGYVKATATSRADPIGTGYQSSCGEVSIDDSFTLVKEGTTQYINYKIPGQDPTCTDAGFTTYYIDPVNNIFYTALSFTTNKRIGDAEALATWKAQGGGGYIAPYGHDWKFVDEDIHECLRCKATEEHTGADDFICDDCNGILLETAIAVTKAKGEAKAELKEAVGEKTSDKLAEILSDACEAVDAATTLDGIATVKEQGLSDIAAQKATELEEKRAGILPRWESILESDEYSDVVKSMVREFVSRVNAAETLKEIDHVVDMYAPAIQLRSARDHWIAELEGLLPEEPSATVISIVEDACELIENDEDMWAFSYVYDITRQAVERQLVTESNMEAMDILLKQAAEDLETANNTIATLNNTIKSKDATIAEKQAAFDTATEQLNAAKAALEVSKVDLEKAQANIEELEGTVSEQDEALKQAAQDIVNKQAALDEMTENYNTASAALATAQKNLEETTKALNEAVTANEQTKKDLEEANASLKTANDTIVELNNTIKSKDATIAEKQAALDTATEQLNVAKTDLETTKTNLEKAKANIEELEGMVSEQDEALKQAAQDLKDTQETLSKAEQDIKDLQAEIDRLKALLDDDPQLEGKIGDVNCDDLIDMKDVLLLRKYLVGIDKIDKLKTADCNGDGEVDMKDVLTLRKYLAGYIETLDV